MRRDASRRRTAVWVGLLLILSGTPVALGADIAGGPDRADVGSRGRELDTYLTAARDVRHFQGVVLVARDGRPVLEKGYGDASVELGVPNTPETKFLIGSITKQFTAALILQLQEQGKLDVQDPITKYLTDYPPEPGARITIRHLLTHTSGLPSYTDDAELMARRTVDASPAEVLATFRDLPLQFEPGTEFRYSNSGYFLLGLIIEAVTGQPYEQLLTERILQPLGMSESGYGHNEAILKHRARGHAFTADEWANTPQVAMSLPFAAGSMYSTARDLLRWDQALYGARVLADASKAQMFTPGLGNYGYGWMITEINGHRVIAHDGGIDGFTSHLARYVDDKVTVIVLCNNESLQASTIGFACASIIFGQPYDLPVKKSPAALSLNLDDYPGAYPLGDRQYRVIRRDGDGLVSQRTGGPAHRLFPEALDRFFYEHDHATTISFERDAAGKVIASVMHQQGVDTRIERLVGPVADSLLVTPRVAEIDPAILTRYVGEYELAPTFNLTFRVREGRLFAQATGQTELELFPSSETEFFYTAVDARISFEVGADGTATGLVLHQGGRDMPAKKTH